MVPKYLFKGSYNATGLKGVFADGGTGRHRASAELVESLGGTLEAYYFAFGEYDFYGIAELPDRTSALAVSGAVAGSGSIARFETIPLIDPEEVDAAAALGFTYRKPGG